MKVEFIDEQAAFNEYCRACQQQTAIALDTEFIRVSTFHPKPGLFQINNGERIALVDPLAISDWQLFSALLESPNIVKVLHACAEDIELLVHFLAVKPQAVFDTQVAAAFLGEEYSLSYQSLLQQFLNIEIEKDQRRTDWLHRPLTAEQLHYAADDVRYLLDLYRYFNQRLLEQDKLNLLQQEYQELLADLLDDSFADAVLRVKDAWRLNAKQYARVKQLAIWREKTMRERDLPRKKVAENDALMQLAKQDEWSKFQLFEVQGLPAQTVKQEGDHIIALLAQVNQRDDYSERMQRSQKDKITKQIQRQLQQLADKHHIHPLLLADKQFSKLLHQQLREKKRTLPQAISGWRRAFYQQVLEQILALEEDLPA